MPTRIFLDTEFTGLDQGAQLISIGLVSENGHCFYAELTDFDASRASAWVRENVLVLLSGSQLQQAATAKPGPEMLLLGNREEVAQALRSWLTQFSTGPGSLHLWADVPAWDWVLFCGLFGGAFGLPESVHYIVRDLATWLEARGLDPDTPREQLGSVHQTQPNLRLAKHHALYDALLEQSIYARLQPVAG